MQVGGSGSLRSEINVTPLVDVILVLLIIFMVITPVVQMGYLVKVPPKAPAGSVAGPDPNQIIIRLTEGGRVYINREEMTVQQFPARINAILKGNTGRMVFFSGSPDVNYEETMKFLDSARAAGAHNIGIIAEELGTPN
ncbi:MAG TPA: biopolymer transporter ExbD [Thermoanaerobaculia bacterium]|nr:biopolymer transporter ExbD [Thermoanaerobaculia bacterium]